MKTKQGLLPKAVKKSLITLNITLCSELVGTEADCSELMMGDKKMQTTYVSLSTEKYVRRRKNTKMKELLGSSGLSYFQVGRPSLP